MIQRLSILLVSILLTANNSVSEQKGRLPPKDLPAYGPIESFSSPQVREMRLANGMTLWLVPRQSFPKVSLTLVVRGGRAADPKDRPGLSDLLSSTLDQGTKTRSAKQIAEEFQLAGSDLSATAEADAIFVATSVLSSEVDHALAILADVFQNANFPENKVELAKSRLSESLKAREAEPSFLASRAFAKLVFGGHPYSVISATRESIFKSSAVELRQEYLRRFRPDQALLVLVGDFQEDSVRNIAKNLFGSWSKPEGPPVSPVEKPASSNPPAVFVVNRPGSVQTTFLLGVLGPTARDPDFAAAQVANAIYGGMFGSRLINNIREDKGYTYSPAASLQTRQQVGLFQTQADVRNEVTGATFNEISYEMNRMVTTTPNEDELAKGERFLVGTRAIQLQLQAAVSNELASLWVSGLPAEELGLQSKRILKVVASDVEAVGKKYFSAARQTVVLVGEEKAVRDQLIPLGVEIKPAPEVK